MNEEDIYVTRPFLPPLDDFIPYLERIWAEKWLTNGGHFHQELEAALTSYLGVRHLSLFSNGTIALITALQSLRITGEAITTPYSFVATTHALHWNGIKPVFVDVDPVTLNIDPRKIEAAITPQTTAILGVHVYGNPCDTEAIQRIADTYGLKVVYDAAHAFGVRRDGESILNAGDISVLSFHATKTFNTFEGGAIVLPSSAAKRRIDLLKNFGFVDEVTVVAPGINGKMNEVQAAFGLLHLAYMGEVLARRQRLHARYSAALQEVPGLRLLPISADVSWNYSYFPIFLEDGFPIDRDALHESLKARNIYSRRYFYPLISDFPPYNALPSARVDNLPVAAGLAKRVLCLPMYPDLTDSDQDRVIDAVLTAARARV